MDAMMKGTMGGITAPEILELPLEREEIFSDFRGNYKKGVEKRQRKLLGQVSFLKPFLQPEEKILLVTSGCSPITLFEQMVTGWILFYLKRCLLVFTNKRILHIPTKVSFKTKSSMAQILLGDVAELRMRGPALFIMYKNKKKEKFLYIKGPERRKLKALIEKLALTGEESVHHERTHLCPRCRKPLEKGIYACPHCHLAFKDKAEGKRVVLIYPGGGYFYTGHPWLGVGDAMTELALLFAVITTLVLALKGGAESWSAFITMLIVLVVEKLVSVYHSNHFIDEYIPREKENFF